MSKYFNYFPKISYYLQNDPKSVDNVTNITTRFSLEKNFTENTSVYYNYVIRDGETPEILAKRFYGDQERHWMILMVNEIVDPFYDWPLEQRSMIRFISNKYSGNNYADTANTNVSGLTWARQNTHSYYKIVTTTFEETSLTKTFEIDEDTYDTLIIGNIPVPTLPDGATITKTVEKTTKSYYDYEYDLNEEKRKIKVLKPEFASALQEEFLNVTNTRRL